jgi:hypothetical protein
MVPNPGKSKSLANASSTPREFDDIVPFIPVTTLMNKMVTAGKLP